MPRSKSKKRRHDPPSPEAREQAAQSRRTRRFAIWAAVAVLASGGGWLWWQSQADETAFLNLVTDGQALLAQVESPANRGGGHPASGHSTRYDDPFPTSGPHNPDWVLPGFYDRPQPPSKLVHALEHGNVVIYYERPGEAVLATLDDWANLYDFEWGGVVAVPAPSLGQAVVLTAWRKRLRLDTFDAATAAAFVDEYRGRGPENPIR